MITTLILVVTWLFVGYAIGFWCGIVYLTGKEHAQTEKWENEANYSKIRGD